jgi:hypothetical protein
MNKNVFSTNGIGSAGPNPNQKMGFSQLDQEVTATRGVKLKSRNSIQKAQEEKEREEYKAKFEQNADRTVQFHDDKSKRILKVISSYMQLIDDRTLVRNRGSIANDVEREIREQIINLAVDLNNDETEEEDGKGSIVVLIAVTKALMKYRDRLNELEYTVKQLQKDFSNLSSKP